MKTMAQIEREVSTYKPDNVHAEGDDNRTLCGKIQTRNDPVTDDLSDVDCLSCILILQAKGHL